MMENERSSFAAWVRSRRAVLKLTQEQVCEFAAISRPTLRRMEAGLPVHPSSRRAVEAVLRRDKEL